MPIKIPNDLPAVKTLADENIFVMTETRAITQDIRPLKILLLNLMPKKIETETQLSRLLGNSPLQVDFEFIHTKSHVHSTFHICWGAQAGLYYHYGINKQPLSEKLFGIFPHKVNYKRSMLFRGFDDVFMVPQSRHTTVKTEDVAACDKLKILASSERCGIYLTVIVFGNGCFTHI